jgi:hypothetical protein
VVLSVVPGTVCSIRVLLVTVEVQGVVAAGGGVDLRLWGKSRGLPGRYPLVCHLLDSGAAARCLWDVTSRPG